MKKDRITGCLVGGVIGDALGYEVEFSRLSSIQKMYGADGMRDLKRLCDERDISADAIIADRILEQIPTRRV